MTQRTETPLKPAPLPALEIDTLPAAFRAVATPAFTSLATRADDHSPWRAVLDLRDYRELWRALHTAKSELAVTVGITEPDLARVRAFMDQLENQWAPVSPPTSPDGELSPDLSPWLSRAPGLFKALSRPDRRWERALARATRAAAGEIWALEATLLISHVSAFDTQARAAEANTAVLLFTESATFDDPGAISRILTLGMWRGRGYWATPAGRLAEIPAWARLGENPTWTRLV